MYLRNCQYLLVLLMMFVCSLSGCSQPTSEPNASSGPGSADTVRTESTLDTGNVTSPPLTAGTPQASGTEEDSEATTSAAWMEEPDKAPFGVSQYLKDRQPDAESERWQAYKSGLNKISRALGNSGVAALESQIGELADVDRLLSGSVAIEQIDRVLAEAGPALSDIRRAQSLPLEAPPRAVFVYDLRIDALMPNVQAARSLSRLMVLETFQSCQQKQPERAFPAMQRNLQLSRDLQPRGVFISQLVSMAIDQMTFDAVTRLLLESTLLEPAHCDRLLQILIQHERQCLPRYVEGLKADYITSMNSLADVRDGKLDPELFWSMIGAPSPVPLRQHEFESDMETMSRLTRIALDEAQTPYPQVPQPSRFATELESLTQTAKAQLQAGNLVGLPLATLFILPAVEISREAELRSQAALAGLFCQLAVRRYELVNGYVPANLTVAISETPLKKIPDDPYTNQPMKFAVLDGTPMVYAVGKDRQDDGGKVDWNYGQQPGDVLFPLKPLPGTTMEANAAGIGDAMRVWTSNVGTTIEAEFVQQDGAVIVLRTPDGSQLRVEISQLSPADQKWVTQQN